MAITYLNSAMIELPASIAVLSAGNLYVLNSDIHSLSTYNFYANNIINNTDIFGDLTVYGSLTALSGIDIINTLTTGATSLSVSNIGPGPALYVSQGPNVEGVAVFKGSSQEILRINNIDPDFGAPTVIVTKGPANKALSANGISLFETISAKVNYIDNFNTVNLIAASGTISNLNNSILTNTTINTNTINSTTITTSSINVNNSLIMPADSNSFFGNMTVYGQINALSGIQNIGSFLTEASALSVINNADAPALFVRQTGYAGAIASFAGTGNVEVLRVNSPDPAPLVPGIIVTGNVSATNVVYASAIKISNSIITSDDKIGIGTLTPSQKLDVAGSIRSTGDCIINEASPSVFLQDTDGKSAILHVNSNYFYVLRTANINSTAAATLSNGQWPFYTSLENGNTNVGGNFSIQGFNRNQAGIVHDPYSLLQIIGVSGSERMLQFASDTSLSANRSNVLSRWILGANSTAETGSNVGSDFYINGYNDAGTYSGPSFFIKRSSNNVGIGTSSPTDSLHVNGFARAKGFKPDVSIATSTTTLSVGQILGVDTTSSVVSALLPASPSIGNMVQIFDSHRKWDTNNCIIVKNGQNIEGSAQNIECDVAGSIVTLIYVSASRGWAIVT